MATGRKIVVLLFYCVFSRSTRLLTTGAATTVDPPTGSARQTFEERKETVKKLIEEAGENDQRYTYYVGRGQNDHLIPDNMLRDAIVRALRNEELWQDIVEFGRLLLRNYEILYKLDGDMKEDRFFTRYQKYYSNVMSNLQFALDSMDASKEVDIENYDNEQLQDGFGAIINFYCEQPSNLFSDPRNRLHDAGSEYDTELKAFWPYPERLVFDATYDRIKEFVKDGNPISFRTVIFYQMYLLFCRSVVRPLNQEEWQEVPSRPPSFNDFVNSYFRDETLDVRNNLQAKAEHLTDDEIAMLNDLNNYVWIAYFQYVTDNYECECKRAPKPPVLHSENRILTYDAVQVSDIFKTCCQGKKVGPKHRGKVGVPNYILKPYDMPHSIVRRDLGVILSLAANDEAFGTEVKENDYSPRAMFIRLVKAIKKGLEKSLDEYYKKRPYERPKDDSSEDDGNGGGQASRTRYGEYLKLLQSSTDERRSAFEKRFEHNANEVKTAHATIAVAQVLNASCPLVGVGAKLSGTSMDFYRNMDFDDIENTGFKEFNDGSIVQQFVIPSSVWPLPDDGNYLLSKMLPVALTYMIGPRALRSKRDTSGSNAASIMHGLLFVNHAGHPVMAVLKINGKLTRVYNWDEGAPAGPWVKASANRRHRRHLNSVAGQWAWDLGLLKQQCSEPSSHGAPGEAVLAGNLLVLRRANLLVVQREFERTVRGRGFYYQKYDSWREYYLDQHWIDIHDEGEYMTGNKFRLWPLGTLPWGHAHYGHYFSDGSFSVGISSDSIRADDTDSWLREAYRSVNDWLGGEYYGQIYFDRHGRPVAIAIAIKRYFRRWTWAFEYVEGDTWRWSEKEWYPENDLSLNPQALKFRKTNVQYYGK